MPIANNREHGVQVTVNKQNISEHHFNWMMALFLLKIMMNNSLSYCCIILLVFLLSSGSILAQLDEQERRLEFHKRGYKFPPETFAPDTPGWRKLNERRFNQIQHIQDRSDRYRAWVIAAISAYVQQNFTREGW